MSDPQFFDDADFRRRQGQFVGLVDALAIADDFAHGLPAGPARKAVEAVCQLISDRAESASALANAALMLYIPADVDPAKLAAYEPVGDS